MQLNALSSVVCLQCFCFQCFDAVNWEVGRASSL